MKTSKVTPQSDSIQKIIYFIKHHKLLIISILVIFTLTLLAFYLSLHKSKITYTLPRHGEIVEAIYGLGKVKTDRIYEVKVGVVTIVDKIMVKEGQSVRANDLLVRLADNIVFRAPFSGTVTQINASDKQPVFPQMSILKLEDYSKKYIEVALEQQGALRVKINQPVTILFESLRGETQKGKVTSIFSRNDEFLAHIEAPGLSEYILPGMTADIAIEAGRKKDALLIPLASISNGKVLLMRNNKQVAIPLKIGNIDGAWAEVVEGDIQEGDLLITSEK